MRQKRKTGKTTLRDINVRSQTNYGRPLVKPVQHRYGAPLMRPYHFFGIFGMVYGRRVDHKTVSCKSNSYLLAKNKQFFILCNFKVIRGIVVIKQAALYGSVIKYIIELRLIVKKYLLWMKFRDQIIAHDCALRAHRVK